MAVSHHKSIISESRGSVTWFSKSYLTVSPILTSDLSISEIAANLLTLDSKISGSVIPFFSAFLVSSTSAIFMSSNLFSIKIGAAPEAGITSNVFIVIVTVIDYT